VSIAAFPGIVVSGESAILA